MVKKLSCGSCGSLKRFPHTFTKCKALQYSVYQYSKVCLWWFPGLKLQLQNLKGTMRKHVFEVIYVYFCYSSPL